MQDFYALLGVSRTATEDEIRRAYRDLIAEAMEDQPRFEALSKAFETLKDAGRRAKYDERLASGQLLEGDRVGNATGMSPAATMAMPKSGATRMGGATMVFGPPDSATAAATAAAYSLPMFCPAQLSPCPLKAGQIVPDDGFCSECGVLLGSVSATAPVLKERPLPLLVDSNGREWPLKEGLNIVGREGADVLLPDRSVSRRHAQFQVDGKTGSVTLEDLGSTNGSRYRAEVLAPSRIVALKDGDELRFGAVRLTIRIPAVPIAAIAPKGDAKTAPAIAPKERLALPSFSGETAPLPPPTDDGSARLVGTGGNALMHALGDVAETTVGRRPENTLMITTDPYVSGKHAVVLFENGRYKVMDIGSTNGTRWNGRKLLPQVPQSLSDGDEVIFGQTPFLFHAPKTG